MPRGIFGMRRVFGGESGLREVGLCGIHPLTRRYMHGRVQWKKESGKGK